MASEKFDRITYLTLEANSACNLSCINCTRSSLESEGHREAKNLTAAELRLILDQFKYCPIDTIKFIGLSEPMLHPEFHTLCGIVRDYFPKTHLVISTNLMYSPDRSPLFKTIPIADEVYLSVDGTNEIYEKIRAGATYERLLASLKQIQLRVPHELRSKRLFLNFTLNDENSGELKKIYQLKSDYGLAGVRLNLAQNWSSKNPSHHSFSLSSLEKLKPYLADLKGVGGWNYKDCFWPFNGASIDVFGDIKPCTVNTDVPSLGNLFKQNISEIYSSPRYQAMREAILRNRAPKGCENCCYSQLSGTLAHVFGETRGNKPRPRSVLSLQ